MGGEEVAFAFAITITYLLLPKIIHIVTKDLRTAIVWWDGGMVGRRLGNRAMGRWGGEVVGWWGGGVARWWIWICRYC